MKNKNIYIFNACCIVLTIILIIFSHFFLFEKFVWLSLLSDFATLFGVIYNSLLLTNEKYGMHFGIANNICLGIFCLLQRVWFTAAYSLIYCIPSLIYGIYLQRNVKSSEEVVIKRLTNTQIILSILYWFLMVIVLSLILLILKGNLWYLDALLNTSLLVSLFLLTRGYYHSYYYFMIGIVFAVILYSLLAFQEISNLTMLIMWVLYFAGALVGLNSWKNKYKRQNKC